MLTLIVSNECFESSGKHRLAAFAADAGSLAQVAVRAHPSTDFRHGAGLSIDFGRANEIASFDQIHRFGNIVVHDTRFNAGGRIRTMNTAFRSLHRFFSCQRDEGWLEIRDTHIHRASILRLVRDFHAFFAIDFLFNFLACGHKFAPLIEMRVVTPR